MKEEVSKNEVVTKPVVTKEVVPAKEEVEEPKKKHVFPERYGWMYSTKEVADYEGIKLNDAYDINIIQALNAMSYLKSKASYEKWQSKQ